MEITATAYKLEDVIFLKDLPVTNVRFGEPDCYFRAIKNWHLENILQAIEILRQAGKAPQFQFLHAPVSTEEINYLLKIAKTFPDLFISIETFGFLTRIKNNKIAGPYLKLYNAKSLEIAQKRNCSIISLPINFPLEEISKLRDLLEAKKYSFKLEYCFFGRERLLSSWQCFSRRFSSQIQSEDCTDICVKELVVTDSNKPEMNLAVTGNTIMSATAQDKINDLNKYRDAGITDILLDVRLENIKILTQTLQRVYNKLERNKENTETSYA